MASRFILAWLARIQNNNINTKKGKHPRYQDPRSETESHNINATVFLTRGKATKQVHITVCPQIQKDKGVEQNG